MPRSRNSRSASPQKPLSADSSEIERRKTYQNVHDIFCEAIDGDVIKLVLQECNWNGEESIEKLLVIAESQEEQKRYKSKLHRIAEGIFGSLKSEDYSSASVSSSLSPSEKVIRRPSKTSTVKNDKNGDKASEGVLLRGHQNQANSQYSQRRENVASADELEMDLKFPKLPSRLSEHNLSSASSSVHSNTEVSKKKLVSSKTALLSQAQSAFNQQFDDAEGSQRWEDCKDKLSEHYLTNLKDRNETVPMQIPSASVYPDDPAILQAELARPRSEQVHANQDVEKQRSESGRSFPVRLLSRSPDSAEDMKTLPTSMLGHGAMKTAGTDDFMRSAGDMDDTVLKCIYEVHSDLLDDVELQHRLRAQHDAVSDVSTADIKSSTHSSNRPMTLPTIGLSVNAAEFVPRSKPVVTTSSSEVIDSPSPEPASRTKRSNSVEIKAGVKNASISSPAIPISIRSPLTISPALSPGLSPQMNSPVANLTGSPMFITPKWPQVHSGMPPLQHVVLAPPQQYVHPTPARHISPPAYRFPPTASVPYSTRMVYSVAPSPLFRAAGVSPYVQQPNTQNIEERAAVATGQPIMATSESSQLGQPIAALNTTKLMAQSSFEQKVEKIRKQHQSGVKILIILRGLPGSGKSTLARALQFHGIILSTDDFFMNGNRYEYKLERLNEAHQWNKERAKEAMKMGKSPIVIDNTNTMVWEFKPYITMAVKNTYHVEIFEPDTPWRMKPSELARRTVHGVSLDHIKRMLQRYEHNINLDSILKKKSTPDLKTTEDSELLRFNTSVDEKATFSQGKDVRFHNLHKGDEFRKQKSGESDSDSLSSYHSDTWSNQSSRNASPKPLRSSLKTPGTLQKMEKFKPLASVKPVGITPTVRKVKRKAIKQIESKLSENTLKEVNEMVKEHVNGQKLSVEDVSKTEEELKALLQFCSIEDSELTAAEELIGLKLHDAIHQSFEGSDPGIDPSGSCSDSDGDTKSTDDIPELMKPKSFNYVGNTLNDFAGDIHLEGNINDDGKVKYVCETVKEDRDVDTTTTDVVLDCKNDDNGSGIETVIPTWKDIALVKKSSGSENSYTCIINDAQVIDKNDEVKKFTIDDIDKEVQEFEQKYWGESDIKESKIESNFETAENSWVGEEWENSDKDTKESSKPQRRKKNGVSHDLSLDIDSAGSTCQEKLNEGSTIKKPTVPNMEQADGDDDVCDEVNGDSDNLNDVGNGLTVQNNLICSEDNLISNNLEEHLTVDICSNNEHRNEEDNTDSENSINLPPSKNNVLLSGRNCVAGNNNHSDHDHPHSCINSSLKLLKDSYNDTECAPKSSDDINHCDKHVVDEIASNNVLDITIKDSDVTLKHDYYVDEIDVDGYDIKQTDMKSMNMSKETEELEKETINLVPDKDGGAVGTPKKKSSRKRQEDKKKVPFLNSEDTEKFKKADWSSFPLVSSDTVAVSNNSTGNKLVKGKEMNAVATMTSIEYFNIEVSLNQGGFIGEDVKYLTGNPRKLVNSSSKDVNSDLKKFSGSPAETCSLEKSTTTADLVAMNDSESVEFLRTCFPAVPDEELECVLEICSANVEWAINLLLDWKYSMNLTEDEKKNFSDKMAEIKKDGNMDAQVEFADEKRGPPSLLDICFDFVEKENIANRADIEHQLIKTSKDRLDTIENDNITKIIYQRSLSQGEHLLERRNSLSEIATQILMSDSAKYDVNKEEEKVASDNKSESKSSKKVNSEKDPATYNELVGRRLMDANTSQTLVTDRTTKPIMTLDLQPDAVVQLEDMFGSLECRDNVNSKLSVPIDCKTAWLLYQCVKNSLATSQINHDEHQLLKDEELARKLQEEENSFKRRMESIQTSNGSRSKRRAPTIGYSVIGTIPSENKPVAWTRGNQSLAEIMQEQQKVQDKENEFQRLVENEGANSVISTRLKRQKLYEAFPKVDRAQLDEVFQASCFNLTDTIQVISTSLGEGPRMLPTSAVMTPSSTIDDQKLLEATKKQSVEDLLDSYSLHPVASKDYQDGVEPEYEDYRGEANLHHRLRHECFVKAREAYSRGLKQVASFYSQQGHQHTQKLKEANMRASDQILAERNNEIEKNLTLDLHGLHIDEAREALNRIIPQKERERCKQLTVITGRGSHSRGGVAKLRPSVIDYLNRNKYNYTEVSIGVFKVSLKYRTPDR